MAVIERKCPGSGWISGAPEILHNHTCTHTNTHTYTIDNSRTPPDPDNPEFDELGEEGRVLSAHAKKRAKKINFWRLLGRALASLSEIRMVSQSNPKFDELGGEGWVLLMQLKTPRGDMDGGVGDDVNLEEREKGGFY